MYKPWRHLISASIGLGVGHIMHKYETTVHKRYKTMIDEDNDEDLFR